MMDVIVPMKVSKPRPWCAVMALFQTRLSRIYSKLQEIGLFVSFERGRKHYFQQVDQN